jgi:hypothetical protein
LILILEPLKMGQFFGTGKAPGGPKIKENRSLGIYLTERLRAAGEVLEGEINGLLSLNLERKEEAQRCNEPSGPDSEFGPIKLVLNYP